MREAKKVNSWIVGKKCESLMTSVLCATMMMTSSVPVAGQVINGQDYRVKKEGTVQNIYKTFSLQSGIVCNIPGYNYMEDDYIVRNYMDKEKKMNLEKLEQIAQLKEDWDGDGAQPFSNCLISRVREIIMRLQNQPEIFPTACDSIQIEYDGTDGSHLEFEISENDVNVYSVDKDGYEKNYSIEPESIDKVVEEFYG